MSQGGADKPPALQADASLPPARDPRRSDGKHWRALLMQLGNEVASALSPALEHINALATTGRIDREGLQALRAQIDKARRIGMAGQRLAHMASGRIVQHPEAVDFLQMLRESLSQRSREAAARGIRIQPALVPARIAVDPALLYALVQATLDWLLNLSRSDVACELEAQPEAHHVHWRLRFSTAEPSPLQQTRTSPAPATLAALAAPTASEDELSFAWRLVQQVAATLDIPLDRQDAGDEISVVLTFAQARAMQVDPALVLEADTGTGSTLDFKPLGGTQVLVIASRRDVRAQVRDAVRHMGLMLDFVTTVEEAQEFCRGGYPHAIVCESALIGQRYERLRESILAELPHFVFIEIDEEGRGLQLAGQTPSGRTRIGRDAILESLPSALMFQLSGLPMTPEAP